MKNLFVYTFALLLVIFALICCGENEIFSECNQNILEKGSTSKGFFSDECELNNMNDEGFFIIQNKSDFLATVNCDQQFPEIDFEKYTLLVGQKELTWCCATALKQEITKDCEDKQYTYTIKLNDPDGKYEALSTFYHWVILSKVPSDYQVNFQLEYN